MNVPHKATNKTEEIKKIIVQMKKIMILVVVIVAIASCNKADDLTGDTLHYGKHPVVLSAQIEGQGVTRAAGKDAWTAGDKVAVKIGNKSKVDYIVAANLNTLNAPIGSETYWQSTIEKKNISAWYPAEDANSANISDQSGGYAAFNYLKAELSNYTFNQQQSGGAILIFSHQMVKVKVVLAKGDGVSDVELNGATVKIYGNTIVSTSSGAVINSNTLGWITSTSDREGLLPPATHTSNTKFIEIKIGDLTFYYTPTSAITLTPGKLHTYNITVDKSGVTLTSQNITGFNDGGSDSGIAEEIIFYNIGDIFPKGATGNDIKGVVFFIEKNGDHGKIVSLDETKDKWSTNQVSTNAKDDTNGRANMKTVWEDTQGKNANTFDKYQAFAWVHNKNTNASIDVKNYSNVNAKGIWYLPAKDELVLLYKNKIAVTETLNQLKKTLFSDDYYWSSTEISHNGACEVYFQQNGFTGHSDKINVDYVRAVLAF